MAASLRQRISSNSVRSINNVIRRSISGQTASKSSIIPMLTGTAILGGGIAAYAYTNKNNFRFLPAVHASAPLTPKPGVLERTFIMVKPDGVARGLVADIIKRFEQRGYKLVAIKMLQPGNDLLNEHYGDLKGKPFYPGLIKHISSGPVVAMVWEGKKVVSQGRQMLGETDPLKSKPGSIRGDFSIDLGRNIIHGSDSVESAEKEIALWFSKGEVMYYKLPLHYQVFE